MSTTPRIPNHKLLKAMRPCDVESLPSILVKNMHAVTFDAGSIMGTGFAPAFEFTFCLVASHGNHVERD